MTADVISLASQRAKHAQTHCCPCNPALDITCYPHRLVQLAERVEAARVRFEEFQWCDNVTFERLTTDVLDVLAGITDECLPDERTAR